MRRGRKLIKQRTPRKGREEEGNICFRAEVDNLETRERNIFTRRTAPVHWTKKIFNRCRDLAVKRLSIGETTTKEMARQARSPAINNAVKTEALASVNNRRGRKKEKKNTRTLWKLMFHRWRTEIEILSLSLSLSLCWTFIFLSFEFENRPVFFFFSLFFCCCK